MKRHDCDLLSDAGRRAFLARIAAAAAAVNLPTAPAVAESGGTDRQWPPETRKSVEARQEKHYRKLSDRLGLKGNPAAAYRLLCKGPPPPQQFDPNKLRYTYGVAGALPQSLWPDFDKAVARQLDRLLPIEVPTHYEEPGLYMVLTTTLAQLQGALDRNGSSKSSRPLLATLASGEVNARISKDIDSNEVVIFFERGLFHYFFEFAVALGWGLPPLGIPQLINNAELNSIPSRATLPDEAFGIFTGVMYRYVVQGAPWASEHGSVGPAGDNVILTMLLLSMMERFAMAHEISHARLGHLDNPRIDKAGAWNQEFAADRASLGLVLDNDSGTSRAVLFWSCDLALTALHFLDRALATLAFRTARPPAWVCKTHPDALARRQRLRDALSREELGLLTDETATAWRLCSMSDAILAKIWERTGSLLLIGSQDATPSPMWRERIRSCFLPSGI
jgi:hypothetical protein